MFEAVTKWNAEVEVPGRLAEVLGQAFRVATTGAPGPVHVEFRGHTGQLAVGGADDEASFDLTVDARFASVPPFRPEAEPSMIAEAIGELTSAQRPVIVAGGGVMWSRAERELVELAEKLSIPVCHVAARQGGHCRKQPVECRLLRLLQPRLRQSRRRRG